MVMSGSIVGEIGRINGMFHGKLLLQVATFMVFVEKIVSANMNLIMVEHAYVLQVTSSRMKATRRLVSTEFNLSCNSQDSRILSIPNGDFYGYDQGSYMDLTFDECKKKCLEICCKVVAIGGFELACIVLLTVSYIEKVDKEQNDHHLAAEPRFRKYSYSELKEATKGFREEIGRGAGGIVYKGKLEDGRVAAIKRLNEANQIESEFLAEVNLIGRLNHMNLIDMWGYCAEGKYKMLVYEYMENGSLATNLESNKSLDWRKRYKIALGTARGLAYLHEECLEWVLHCDIKPQNILLDSDYQPKVADFGLSKLQNRNDVKNPSFSRIRGTRGYMAPEWVFNLPITSKVDVYSYGIVVLEMITGKRLRVDGPDHSHHGRLVTWVNEKKKKGKEKEISSWVEL
ncbi:hypothetical protein K1719_043494 [Acacia pycnantha]|nr:hypothetical protein K1719_043494 [Acacia pycnantha]